MSIRQIKKTARRRLKGKWRNEIKCFGAYMSLALAVGLMQVVFQEGVVETLGTGQALLFLNLCSVVVGLAMVPLSAGYMEHIMGVARDKGPGGVKRLFRYYGKDGKGYIALYICLLVSVFLYSLLFLVPGIVKNLAYSLSYYIKIDNPDMSVQDVLKRSEKMMQGHKMEYFLLMLSFIPFFTLGLFTIVGWIPVVIYMQMSATVFYEKLKAEALGDE